MLEWKEADSNQKSLKIARVTAWYEYLKAM